ncbi:MAG: DUF1843 domain-containing protein [Gemmatimonadetes bacterium]|nr:DUF1843 domain-containing protein [Gemmatimonadota bacterium]
MSDVDCPVILDPVLGPICGPMVPYGTPIREAAASGDTARMQQQAASARTWLASNPGHPSAGDVSAALAELDAAIKGV